MRVLRNIGDFIIGCFAYIIDCIKYGIGYVLSWFSEKVFLYAFPQTIDGNYILCIPRGPIRIIREFYKRKEFSWSLYFKTKRSHDKLPKAPAVLSSLYPSLFESKFPDPPERLHMTNYVLSFYPQLVEELFYQENIMVDVMRDFSMRNQLRMYADAGHATANKRSFFVNESNGLFVPSDKRILLREDITPVVNFLGEIYWQNIEDVLGHEIGHFIDWYYGWISTYDREFIEIYKRERGLVDAYSASTPSEYFATTAWLYARFPELSYQYIPDTINWFDKLYKKLSVENILFTSPRKIVNI